MFKAVASYRAFEQAYADRSGVTVKRLHQYRVARPCRCGDEACEGWQMIPKSSRIEDAKLYGWSQWWVLVDYIVRVFP